MILSLLKGSTELRISVKFHVKDAQGKGFFFLSGAHLKSARSACLKYVLIKKIKKLNLILRSDNLKVQKYKNPKLKTPSKTLTIRNLKIN